MFICDICKVAFKKRAPHKCAGDFQIKCGECSLSFETTKIMFRHLRQAHWPSQSSKSSSLKRTSTSPISKYPTKRATISASMPQSMSSSMNASQKALLKPNSQLEISSKEDCMSLADSEESTPSQSIISKPLQPLLRTSSSDTWSVSISEEFPEFFLASPMSSLSSSPSTLSTLLLSSSESSDKTFSSISLCPSLLSSSSKSSSPKYN